MNKDKRKEISPNDLHLVIDELEPIVMSLIEKKEGTKVSGDEVIGCLTEKHFEYIKSVQNFSDEDQLKKLTDIAVTAIMGIISYKVNARNVH